ncbi:hypothetical protein Ancab_007145, partial [Ancistrocladus abbreviatus]
FAWTANQLCLNWALPSALTLGFGVFMALHHWFCASTLPCGFVPRCLPHDLQFRKIGDLSWLHHWKRCLLESLRQ